MTFDFPGFGTNCRIFRLVFHRAHKVLLQLRAPPQNELWRKNIDNSYGLPRRRKDRCPDIEPIREDRQ